MFAEIPIHQLVAPFGGQHALGRRIVGDGGPRKGEIGNRRQGHDPGGACALGTEVGKQAEDQVGPRAVPGKDHVAGSIPFGDHRLPGRADIVATCRKRVGRGQSIARREDLDPCQPREARAHRGMGPGGAGYEPAAVDIEDEFAGSGRMRTGSRRNPQPAGPGVAVSIQRVGRRAEPAASGPFEKLPVRLGGPGAREKGSHRPSRQERQEGETDTHARRASIASQIFAVMFTPSKRSSS